MNLVSSEQGEINVTDENEAFTNRQSQRETKSQFNPPVKSGHQSIFE